MPNYNIVADYSQFKPMDVSIPLSILREIAELNEKYRDKYNKIYEEEGRYVLPEGPYREALLKYLEDLSAAMDAFHNTHGSWESKIALNNMWKRHVTEMLPIKQMVENYNKGLETLYKMGPDAIVGNKEQLLNLDSYYGGLLPLIDYRSKSLLLLIAAKTIQGLDNALMQAPDDAGKIADLYFILKSKGLNGEDALAEILKHNPDINSEEGVEGTNQVIQALDNLYEQSKFKDGTPENEEVWQSIISGAIQGISAPKYSLQSNHAYLNPAELFKLELNRRLENYLYKHDDKTDEITGVNPQFIQDLRELGKIKNLTNEEYVYVPDGNGAKYFPVKNNGREISKLFASEYTDWLDWDLVPEEIRSEYASEDNKDTVKFRLYYQTIKKTGQKILIGYDKLKYVRKKASDLNSNNTSNKQQSVKTKEVPHQGTNNKVVLKNNSTDIDTLNIDSIEHKLNQQK